MDESSIDSLYKLLPAQTRVIMTQPITNCPFEKEMEKVKIGENSQYRRSMHIINGKLPTFLQGVKVSNQEVNNVENDCQKRKLDDMNQHFKIENVSDTNCMTSSLPSHAKRNELGKYVLFRSGESVAIEPCIDSVGSYVVRGTVNAKQNCSKQILVQSENGDGGDPQNESAIDKSNELGNYEPYRIPPNDQTSPFDEIFLNLQTVSIWIHDDNAISHFRNPEVLHLS